MKFIRGMMIGTAITAGAIMMYSNKYELERKKLMKKGKHLVRKIGL